MSHILRTHKSCVILLMRLYSTQRRQTYYDVLRISPNSTQKEIRQAFIKLSKEMHPDTSGKKDHQEFVKINEAYNVLSKENTRRHYDMTLQNNRTNFHPGQHSHSYQNPYKPVYTSRREWEIHMARGTRPNDKQRGPMMHRPVIPLFWVFGFIFVGIWLQVVLLHKSLVFKREALLERSREYSQDYKRVRAAASRLTKDEQVKTFEERWNIRSRGDDMP